MNCNPFKISVLQQKPAQIHHPGVKIQEHQKARERKKNKTTKNKRKQQTKAGNATRLY